MTECLGRSVPHTPRQRIYFCSTEKKVAQICVLGNAFYLFFFLSSPEQQELAHVSKFGWSLLHFTGRVIQIYQTHTVFFSLSLSLSLCYYLLSFILLNK